MPRFEAFALLIALALLSASCRPEPSKRRTGVEANDATAALQTESIMTEHPSESLHFEVEVPPRVGIGEAVPIRLRAKNIGKQPLELYLQGRTIAFDIIVARANGPVVWRRLAGQTIPAILRIEVLEPGEVLELTDTWDQLTKKGEPVGPGRYTVEGVLPTDSPEPLKTRPAPLRIVPQ